MGSGSPLVLGDKGAAVSETPRLRRRAKGARPYFFDDPTCDKLLSIIMGLAGEVSVLQDRLDTTLRLLEERGTLSRADLEAYQPDAEVRTERDAWREEFLGRLLRVVHIELEADADDVPDRYRATVEELAKP